MEVDDVLAVCAAFIAFEYEVALVIGGGAGAGASVGFNFFTGVDVEDADDALLLFWSPIAAAVTTDGFI